jgi:subtilisin family serine protease
MGRHMKLSVLFALILAVAPLHAGSKLTPTLLSRLHSMDTDEPVLVWVYFTDKGEYESGYKPSNSLVSERSLLRRRKVKSPDQLVDYTDLPVDSRYLDELKAVGAELRHRSRWFNCASVLAGVGEIHRLEALPFVHSIDLVWRARRERLIDPESPQFMPTPPGTPAATNLDYGLSLPQVQLINVPDVHNMGNSGQGVLVGVFDNGFRLLQHEAFDSLRTRLVATYDFVDHKVSVVPNHPDPGFGAHGILTLSTLGGYKPGELIGPAYGASFILARTENDSSETPIEEDNWVAAIEWADSIGVDVTSTSLGYLGYDPPYTSWTWEDMDGNTTLITRAADMAVSKGIVVVNSAGNNGLNVARNTLNAPADGDSVMAVGATTSGGTRATFSSVGPSASTPARIKPDVMAQGTTVRCASPTIPTLYTYSQGTSLSCPLVAGVAALLIHANANATPATIADALRLTASQAGAPDNLMGWGVVNARAAVTYITGGGVPPGAFTLRSAFPNPFPTPSNPTTSILFTLSEASRMMITIHTLLGQLVRTIANDQRTSGMFIEQWDGTNSHGLSVASGVYFCVLQGTSLTGRSFFQTAKVTVLR